MTRGKKKSEESQSTVEEPEALLRERMRESEDVQVGRPAGDLMIRAGSEDGH